MHLQIGVTPHAVWIHTDDHIRLIRSEDEAIEIPVPFPVKRFIYDFDHGDYPDLIYRPDITG